MDCNASGSSVWDARCSSGPRYVDVEYKLDGGTLKTVTHRDVSSLAALQTEVTGELVRLRQDSKILSTFREIDQFVKESGVLQLDDTPAAKE